MTSANDEQIVKLRQAIQALEAQRAILGDEVVSASQTALQKQIDELLDASQPTGLERKVATILFADIAGHTELIQDLDPEENLEIIEEALRRLAQEVETHNGRIARFEGDGLKAVFGLPLAQETDPENAVRAGLGIITAARQYGQELQQERGLTGFGVRVGIDTGLVVAGSGTEKEDTISGLTVNLASRLEHAAPPDTLLISHNTYQHIRGIFDVETREALEVKGFPDPVAVYRVIEEKPRAFRMGRRGVEGIETRTIGRDRELAIFKEAYLSATDKRQSTVVTIVGEAGVGKSRLVYEFSNWLELRQEMIWLFKGRCTRQGQDQPYYLIRDMLADRFDILDSDSLATMRQKFVNCMADFFPTQSEMKAHVLGTWLGYDFYHSQYLEPILDDPEQIMNRATLYLSQVFSAAGKQDPVVVMLDDIHWADRSSLDVTMDLVRRRPDLPMLVVCLTRPSLYERRPEWGQNLPHQRIDLAPLPAETTRSLVAEILRLVDPLPPLLLDVVSSRAEGNPFYAEELVKMLIDDGVIVTSTDKWQLKEERLLKLDVPPTLTGILQARLDKLKPPEKLTAQKAAVIGRTFWDQALAALGDGGPQALPTLQDREFVFWRPDSAFAGTDEYIFKHAILRDVIYETVLKRARAQYHANIAGWLVAASRANGRSDEYAALIGEHFQQAGDSSTAADWYSRAAGRASASFAHEEAIHYAELALDLTAADNFDQRFELLKTLETIHNTQGDRDAQRTDLTRMETEAGQLGKISQVTVALKKANFYLVTSDYQKAQEQAQLAVELSDQLGEKDLAAEGYWHWSTAFYHQGQYAAALEYIQQSLSLAREQGNQKMVANCLNIIGLVAIEQDDYATGDKNHQEALMVRRQIGDLRGEAVSLNNLGVSARSQGKNSLARDYYQASLKLKREIGDRRGVAETLTNLGNMFWMQGNYPDASDHTGRALTIFREINDRRGESVTLNNLGLVAIAEGDPESARNYYNQSLATARQIGNRWSEGLTLLNMGETNLALGDLTFAKNNYLEAVTIHEQLSQVQLLAEDWAGLAMVQLQSGNKEKALVFAKRVLEYLRNNPRLDGAEDPVRSFHFIWEVFRQVGEEGEAREILARAGAVMKEDLGNEPEPELREMYLKQPHHKILWPAWVKARESG